MKLLALDVGEKRVGLAESDELEIIASPKGYIYRIEAIDKLKAIIDEEKIEKIIVGMPFLPTTGELGSQGGDVNIFINELKGNFNLPIEIVTEVFTSVEAEKRLREIGGEFEKGDIDAMAATIILETYLRSVD